MSLTLVGSGGIFTRLGAIGCEYRNVVGFSGTTAPSSSVTWGSTGTGIRDTQTQFAAIDATINTAGLFYSDGLKAIRDNLRSVLVGPLTNLQGFAQSIILQQVNAYQPMEDPSSISEAFEIIRNEMNASTQSIKNNTVSLSTTAATGNTGDPVVTTSLVGPDGITRQRIYPETLILTVTGSAQIADTAGSEPLSLVGKPQVSTTEWNWPQGSGANLSLTVTDATLDNQRNLLTNSSDFTFTVANTPDNWAAITGAFGTRILDGGSGSGYRGGTTKAVKLLSNGAELTKFGQTFNSSGGTLGRLYPYGTTDRSTVYAFNSQVAVSATPVAGVLGASLVDSTNTVITNEAGTAQTLFKTLTSVSTAFVPFNGYFQTPSPLPSTVKLSIGFTTAMDNTKFALVDDVSLIEAEEAYAEGPYVTVFRGATEVALDDTWTITASNNAPTTGGVFTNLFWRWCGTEVAQLPTASSPTISDSLVT